MAQVLGLLSLIQNEVPSSWLLPGPASAIVAFVEKQWMDAPSFAAFQIYIFKGEQLKHKHELEE